MKSLCKRLIVTALIIPLFACTDRPMILLQEAENAWYKNEYREAIRLFLQVVERYPKSPQAETALLRTGETYMLNLANTDKAIEYFTAVISKFPEGEAARIAHENMGSIFEYTKKDYDKAVIQYQYLIDNGIPEDADKYQFAIARCYYQKGDYQQAILEYEMFQNVFPKSELVPESKYQIGNCFFVMNDCANAMVHYRKTLEDFPNIASRYDIMLSIGVCLEGKEDYGQALHLYRQILDKYPNTSLIERKIDSVLARMREKNR